jgi:plastocyanin
MILHPPSGRLPRTVLSSLALAATSWLIVPSGGAAQQATEVHMVSGPIYRPDAITVPAGTTVRFVNDDTDIHTVTARDNAYDSGLMFQNQAWTYTYSTPGTYEYYCLPHPWMVGTIEVQ